MGVYIKGVGMPKSCYECKLDLKTGVCPAFCEWIENNPYSIKSKGRLPNCPLVELPSKHGRLVDADALISDTNERYKQQKTEHEKNVIDGLGNAIGGLFLDTTHTVVINALSEENAPTVLEAEGDD